MHVFSLPSITLRNMNIVVDKPTSRFKPKEN